MIFLALASADARTIFNAGNPDAKRLYDDLLSNYNKLVRPVVNTTDPLTVRIKLKLSQLIDVVSFNVFKNQLNWTRKQPIFLNIFLRGENGQHFGAGAYGRKMVVGRRRAAAEGRNFQKNVL